MGAERVVTSREMTLTEIAQLHKDCPDMEIESFVHAVPCLSLMLPTMRKL